MLLLLTQQAVAQVSQTEEARQPETQSEMSRQNIQPSGGAIFFHGNNRPTAGLIYDLDVVHLSRISFGFESGALFSTLGSVVRNSSGSNTYVAQIPACLRFTLSPGPESKVSFSPHIGANLIFSSGYLNGSFGSSSDLSGTTSTQTNLDAHFSVGSEVKWKLSKLVNLGLRYDSTFLTAFTMHTLTLGVGFTV